MAQIERRLAAIMLADIAGYSTLMERAEARTFERVRTLTPPAKREAIRIMTEETGPSVSRACQVARLTRTAYYKSGRTERRANESTSPGTSGCKCKRRHF